MTSTALPGRRIAKITDKYRRQLLRAIIRQNHSKKHHLSQNIRETNNQLGQSLPPTIMAWLKDACLDIERCEARDSSRRLAKKLHHLSSRQPTPPASCARTRTNDDVTPPIDTMPTPPTVSERVNVLSKQCLPEATNSLLGKGPQFALTQQVTASILRTVELGMERLAYTIRCRKHRARAPAQELDRDCESQSQDSPDNAVSD